MTGLTYMDTLMNLLFFVDIIINFFTAYYDSDFDIVDSQYVSPNKIKNYWVRPPNSQFKIIPIKYGSSL